IDDAVTLYVCTPSVVASATPVTVTACGVNQLAGVKTRGAEVTTPSVASELSNVTVTFAVGALVRTAVNSADPPSSVVRRPAEGALPVDEAEVLEVGYGIRGYVPVGEVEVEKPRAVENRNDRNGVSGGGPGR